MKKLFYSLAIMFFCTSMNAAEGDSLWGNANGEETAKFNSWGSDTGGAQKPFGWYRSVSTGSLTYELTSDRNGVEGEALKLIRTGANSTWHTQLKSDNNAAQADYSPINITAGKAFYFTFWAKASVAGTKIYAGPEGALVNWQAVPEFELTTEWKRYGIVITSDQVTKNNNQFNFHLRTAAEYYIDDLEIREGSDMTVGIDENAEESNPITIMQSDNGISFICLGGLVEIYDSVGKIVYKQTVDAEITNVPIAVKGLYFVKLTKNGKSSAVKALVN